MLENHIIIHLACVQIILCYRGITDHLLDLFKTTNKKVHYQMSSNVSSLYQIKSIDNALSLVLIVING